MLKLKYIVLLLLLTAKGYTQPYFELVGLHGTRFPESPFVENKRSEKVTINWLFSFINVPVQLNKRNLILFSPVYELREISDDRAIDESLKSFSLPLTYVYTLKDTSSTIIGSAIYKYAAGGNLGWTTQTDMVGGALLYTHKTKPTFTYKLGVYYNQEFFGDLWLPLIGYDWQISKRCRSWAILPRFLFFDYKLSSSFHTGFFYRGVQDSYLTRKDGSYLKIQEGQLRVYVDYYIPKTALAITFMAGHTTHRDYTLFNPAISSEEQDVSLEENVVFNLGLSYRIIRDKNFK